MPDRRYAPIGCMLYIYAAEVVAGLLSILITFAPAGLYPAYVHPHADPALVSLVRNEWGLSVGGDQQLAGLVGELGGHLDEVGHMGVEDHARDALPALPVGADDMARARLPEPLVGGGLVGPGDDGQAGVQLPRGEDEVEVVRVGGKKGDEPLGVLHAGLVEDLLLAGDYESALTVTSAPVWLATMSSTTLAARSLGLG